MTDILRTLADRCTPLAKRAALVAAYALVLSIVFVTFLRDPGIDGFRPAVPARMVKGTALKPYVYRTLLPSITSRILAAIPDDRQQRFNDWLLPRARWYVNYLGIDDAFPAMYAVIFVLLLASFVGWVIAFRYLARAVYRVSDAYLHAVTLVALGGLATTFCYVNYIYDPPTLFLITLGLGLMARGRFAPYLLVFAIGLVNKETTIVLALVFGLHYAWRMPAARYLGLLAAQIGLFAASRVWLNHLFGENFGRYTILQLWNHNIKLIGRVEFADMMAAALLVALVLGHWREKPRFLRRALWLLAPLVGACAIWGFLDELRDYHEGYSVIVLLAAGTVAKWVGADMVAIPDPDPQPSPVPVPVPSPVPAPVPESVPDSLGGA